MINNENAGLDMYGIARKKQTAKKEDKGYTDYILDQALGRC